MSELLKEIQSENETLKCFLCSTEFSEREETYLLFEKRLKTNGVVECSLADVLSTVLGRQLSEQSVHSKLLCSRCNDSLHDFEMTEQHYLDMKYKIIRDFNRTANLHGFEGVMLEVEENGERFTIFLDDTNAQENIVVADGGVTPVQIMTAMASPHADNMDEGSPDKIKMEEFDSSIETEEYYEASNDNMVEIITDDVPYEQIIEHTSQASNDSTVMDHQETSLHSGAECEESSVCTTFLKSEDNTQPDPSSLSPLNEGAVKHRKKVPKTDDNTQIVKLVGEKYVCLLCNLTEGEVPYEFDARTVAIHVKSVHNQRVYICDLCGEDFRKRNYLTDHMDDEHGGTEDGEFQCETCNRIFTNLRLFRIHKRLHYSSSKSFLCVQCNKKYSSKNLLDEHMNMHTGRRPYKCTYCPKDFASKYTLTAHLKIHTDRPRSFACKDCNKAFFSAQNLLQHMKTHSGVKEFICGFCKKAFVTQHNLEVHKVVHTGYKPFICRTCGKAFARRAEIKDHERTHTGEKPFTCDICDMSFAQRSNLTTHKRATHLNDKRYKCEQCDRSFKRRRLLDYHVRATHTGERPYKCDTCNATFVYPEHHKKHLRIHTGVKPYACEVCGKTFNSRDNRNAHRFIHSDKKPYECLVCGQGFMRKPLLITHMKQFGHVNDTIVVNQPRLSNDLKLETDSGLTEDSMTQDNEMVEEHLIIDGSVTVGESMKHGSSKDQVGDKSEEILAEEFASVISTDQIIVTDNCHYIKNEDGTMQIIQIRTKDKDGEDRFTWVNLVAEDES